MEKVCPLCGNVEPPLWSDMPMNETIRAYAKAYCLPPITYHYTLGEALDAWGVDWREWEKPYPGD